MALQRVQEDTTEKDLLCRQVGRAADAVHQETNMETRSHRMASLCDTRILTELWDLTGLEAPRPSTVRPAEGEVGSHLVDAEALAREAAVAHQACVAVVVLHLVMDLVGAWALPVRAQWVWEWAWEVDRWGLIVGLLPVTTMDTTEAPCRKDVVLPRVRMMTIWEYCPSRTTLLVKQ